MDKIRTKTKITGGITSEEKARLDGVAAEWIGIAMRTAPIEPDKISAAIKGLYEAASLKAPRVVIVPSPLVMAFAYGASAWIWHCRKSAATDAATTAATTAATYAATDDATDDATTAATYAATDDATYAATYAATRAATDDATKAATWDATYAATTAATRAATKAATYAATDDATYAATYAATKQSNLWTNEQQAAQVCRTLAGKGGLECAKKWHSVYQGGNMWAGWASYISGFHDVLGLDLPEHAAYKFYEDAARHGGFRVIHEEFCIVSDFPEVLRKDDQNRPHCENGPSHRWRDGWSLYHWHGVKIPSEWIEKKEELTPEIALTWENIEQRRAACEILGWSRILDELESRIIDEDGDPEIGTLLEVNIPDSGLERFLKVKCGTGRTFALPVPPTMKTAIQASAWTYGIDDLNTYKPEVRT